MPADSAPTWVSRIACSLPLATTTSTMSRRTGSVTTAGPGRRISQNRAPATTTMASTHAMRVREIFMQSSP